MAIKIGEAFFDVFIKDDKVKKGTEDLSKKFMQMGKAAFGIFSIGTAIDAVVQATIDAQKADAQLNAVLKSTKQVAGLTAGELKNMASELQNMSVFDDEAIIGAESLLLTFTSIGKDVFPQATKAILDMSSALGQDLQSSTIQIGKALNSPIEGISALRRVGVQLSDSQEKLIKNFVETGRLAEAQKVILGELETQFGGSAKAAADTLGGALAQLKNTFGDMLEGTGGGFGDQLKEGIIGLNDALKKSKPLFEVVGMAIGSVLSFFGKLLDYTISFAETIYKVTGPAIEWLVDKFTKASKAVGEFIDWLKGVEIEEKLKEEIKIDTSNAEKKVKQFTTKMSEEWIKARDDAQAFVRDLTTAMETPVEKAVRAEEEGLKKLEEFKKRKFISEQSYQEAVLVLHQQTENAIREEQKRTFAERVSLGQQMLSATGEFLSAIGELSNMDTQNRLQEVSVKKEAQLRQLDETFNKEKQSILENVKNKKKADKAIEKLEEDKAKAEAKINEQADKEASKLQRKAFERQKAFRIIEAGINTAGAIIGFLANPSGPAGLALSILAGITGAIQIATIAAAKPPAMADGGIATKSTLAQIGEAGTEAVFPLEGTRGRKTRQMFADDLISAIGNQQNRSESRLATVEDTRQATYNITFNMGSERFFAAITQAIENREILIDERSLIRR